MTQVGIILANLDYIDDHDRLQGKQELRTPLREK